VTVAKADSRNDKLTADVGLKNRGDKLDGKHSKWPPGVIKKQRIMRLSDKDS
jgi:hypothetical protein